MKFGSLFSGIGGLDLGLERAGMQCAWQVEIDDYATRVLRKHWPNIPKHRDVREVGARNLEPVDLVCGGFPCQDISLAGQGEGIIGERSGLWSQFARVLKELRPQHALIENVPALRGRGLALVLQDLRALGFDAEGHCIPAEAFGAPFERDRIFIVAYPAGMFGPAIFGREQERDLSEIRFNAEPESYGRRTRRKGRPDSSIARQQSKTSSNAEFDRTGREEQRGAVSVEEKRAALERANPHADVNQLNDDDGGHGSGLLLRERPESSDVCGGEEDADVDGEPLVRAAIARGERHAWTVEPGVVRMVSGVPNRVDRIRCLGNAVIPQVAEWIGRRIMELDSK